MLRLEMQLEFLFRIILGSPETVNRSPGCNPANALTQVCYPERKPDIVTVEDIGRIESGQK